MEKSDNKTVFCFCLFIVFQVGALKILLLNMSCYSLGDLFKADETNNSNKLQRSRILTGGDNEQIMKNKFSWWTKLDKNWEQWISLWNPNHLAKLHPPVTFSLKSRLLTMLSTVCGVSFILLLAFSGLAQSKWQEAIVANDIIFIVYILLTIISSCQVQPWFNQSVSYLCVLYYFS